MQPSAVIAGEHRTGTRIASLLLLSVLAVVVSIQIRNGQFREVGLASLIGVLVDLPIAVLAGLCSLHGWGGSPRLRRAGVAGFRTGLAVGAISLAFGVAGPVFFTPESNLAPLIGIIFTGPIGFFLGSVTGAACSLRGSPR